MPICTTMVLYAYLAVMTAAGVVLVGLGRSLRLSAGTIVKMVLGQVIGGALLGVGFLAWRFNGYTVEYGDGGLDTLGLAVPSLLAGAVLSFAAWLPVLRGWHRRDT